MIDVHPVPAIRLTAITALILLGVAGCASQPTAVTDDGKATTAERPAASPRERLLEARAAFRQGDHARTAELLRPLAAQGHAAAQYGLGYMEFYGLGVPRNEDSARYWFHQAAAQGYRQAQEAVQRLAHRRQAMVQQRGPAQRTETPGDGRVPPAVRRSLAAPYAEAPAPTGEPAQPEATGTGDAEPDDGNVLYLNRPDEAPPATPASDAGAASR